MSPTYAPEKSVTVPPFGRVDFSTQIPIVDHPHFQALKYRSQLSLVRETFPGAINNRYNHSLGVMHVAHRLLQSMFQRDFFEGTDQKQLNRDILAVALVHDLGHPPYSHMLEYLLSEFTNQNHGDRTSTIITNDMESAIHKSGANLQNVLRYLDKSSITPGKIVTSKSLGADKIAYIIQDAHMTGYDESRPPAWENLLLYMGWDQRGLFVEEKAAPIVRSLQQFYFNMYTQVYLKKKALGAGRMLQKAVQLHMAGTGIDPHAVWEMPEFVLDTMLLQSPVDAVKEMSHNLMVRNLPKSAVVFKYPDYVSCERVANKPMVVLPLPDENIHRFIEQVQSPSKLTKLEAIVASTLGLEPQHVIITTAPEWKKLVPEDVQLVDNKGLSKGTLFKNYPNFHESLHEHAQAWYGIYVMVPIEHRERTAKAASDIQQIIEASLT